MFRGKCSSQGNLTSRVPQPFRVRWVKFNCAALPLSFSLGFQSSTEPESTMSKDTEVHMKEVELNELDPEKQPMTGDGQAAGGEKNGSVKVKVPEDEVTFTGLSKEELMKVAGTPG